MEIMNSKNEYELFTGTFTDEKSEKMRILA